jgi:hypothetical protein
MYQQFAPYIPLIALGISLIALFLSGANLGWSVFKELGLKARLRLKFNLLGIHHETFSESLTRFVFAVTNMGPGRIKINMIHLRDARWWRRLLRKEKCAVVLHDYEHPLGGKLPYSLEVGEGMDLTFPEDISFMSETFTHIGIADSFGRIHWASKRHMSKARKALEQHKKSNKSE